MASNPVFNIIISQGVDFSETFRSTEANGSATNLSGYTAVSKLKKHPGSSSSVDFSTSITSSTGEVEISLTDNQTTTLDPGRYFYDIVITSSSGTKTRLVEGMATVTAGITI